MRKTLKASQVKKLPVGTNVYIVNDESGGSGELWIVKYGRKKMLKGMYTLREIWDQEGWHYEIEV